MDASSAGSTADGAARRPVADVAAGRRELETMAASFRALAEGADDLGMYRFTFHPGLRVDYINPALEATLGVTLAELQADPSVLWRYLSADAAAALDRNRKAGVQADWPVEAVWRRGDGCDVALQLREVPLRDAAGRLDAVLGIVRDVTRQRREEQALADALEFERRAASGLRRVDELRRLFLQAVSHELRTPLTSVLGFSATLRDRFAELSPADAVALADRVHRHGSRMQDLLDDLLDVERLSRGVVELERRRIDLAGLIEAVVIEQGEAEVELDLFPVAAAVDGPKVERIVVNLISNARRHAGADARIRVGLRERDDVAVLTVDDDGPGVAAEVRSLVFRPFEQGPAAASAASPGTGIGLTLVAEFAHLHGGTARIEDGPLGGARVVVELPLADHP